MRRIHWVVIIGVLIGLIVGGVILKQRRSSISIVYRDVVAARSDLRITIISTGTVQPENRLEIKPPIAGRVEQVLSREGQSVRKGQVLAWMSSTERAALLDAARARGAEELKRWEELYRPTPILAPIAGTIILRNVEAGQTFTATDPVFVMSDRLTVKAQVDETDIGQIALKQRAKITLDAYPSLSVGGRVDQIAFDAKTVNNVTTYVVDVLPEETPREMRSGMTANVTFLVAEKTNALVIPAEGVKVRGKEKFVLVRDRSGEEPREQKVEIGLSDGKRTEVIAGLTEGQAIAIAEIKKESRPPSGTSPFSPMGPGGGRRGSGGGH